MEKTNKQKKHNPALDKTAVFLTLLLHTTLTQMKEWKTQDGHNLSQLKYKSSGMLRNDCSIFSFGTEMLSKW